MVLALGLASSNVAALPAGGKGGGKGHGRRAPHAPPAAPAAAEDTPAIILPTLPSGRPDLWDSYVAAQQEHAQRDASAIAAEYGFRSIDEMESWAQQAQREARVAPRRSGELIALIVDSKKARITSDYGIRVDPLSDGLGTHAGIDIAAPYGTSIFAVAAGTVTTSSYHGGNGFMVEIQHADGTRTRYCHASALLVDKGGVVSAGDKIARVGSTGRSTGAHVHFEVRRNGVPINPHRAVRTLLGNAAKVATR